MGEVAVGIANKNCSGAGRINNRSCTRTEKNEKLGEIVMKRKIYSAIATASFLTLGLTGTAFALHDGGVGHCDACHSMHNSADNPLGANAVANNTLLKGSDASSTCLNCHGPNAFGTSGGSYHIMSDDGTGNSQGGDFYWMNKDYTVMVRGNPVVYSKDDHGHNVVAADFAMLADANTNNAAAPGGTYLATDLGCNSCHDPHGKVDGGTAGGGAPISGSGSYGAAWPTDGSILGNYRLIGDAGYVAPGGLTFTNGAPVARATNVSGQSYGAIVDYGSGMSEFCGNCHGLYQNDSHKHPAGDGEHMNGFGTNYNSYVKTGDFAGVQATAFDALVPFERGVTDKTTTDTALSADPVAGTDANSNVMCLTCHRAHASANPNMGRWDFETELLADSHALNSADVDLTTAKVYYKSGTNGMVDNDIAGEYDAYQRSLCNKCHVQD